jgi:hypothetical protein
MHFAFVPPGSPKPIDRHDPKAISVAMQILADIRPDSFGQVGDLAHLGYLSHWAVGRDMQGKVPAQDGESVAMNIENDNNGINRWLEQTEKILPKKCEKYQLEGTHEEILRNSRQMNKFQGWVTKDWYPEKAWRLAERGIKWVPYQTYNAGAGKNWVDCGRLKIVHGHYAASNHMKKHFEDHGGSVGYGHMHTVSQDTYKHGLNPATVFTFGCLCTKEASYHRGRNNAWAQAMLVIYVQPNGKFNHSIIHIIDGQAMWNGKLYSAKPLKGLE